MNSSPTASGDVLARLADTLETRRPENGGDPAASYVAKLLSRGPDAFLKKIGEEAAELIMAAKDASHGGARDHAADHVIKETADLWFHTLVLLTHYGLRPENVLAELAHREGLSGLEEKAQRKPQ